MRITLIGAGSFVFAPTVVKDVLVESRFDDFEFVFCDVNPHSARLMAAAAEKIAGSLGLKKVVVSYTDDRKIALRNADFVITSVAAEGGKRWMMDYEICKEEGIPELLRECGALGGIAYGFRNTTLIMSICRDMETLCPNAVLLNVSNPLTKVQTAVHRYTGVKSFGFCNAAIGGPVGNRMIARHLGCGVSDVEELSAGINHFAWILGVRDRRTGDDMLPRLTGIIAASDDFYDKSMFNIYEKFGALPAAPGHHEEFLPPERTYAYIPGGDETPPHPPFHGSGEERGRQISALEDFASGKISYAEAESLLHWCWEHPGLVAVALAKGDELYLPMLNIPNDGCMPQLPEGNIVEVPVMIKNGVITPAKSIMLPEKAAEITRQQSEVAEMIAKAAVTGGRKLAHEVVETDSAIDRKEQTHKALDRILELHLDLMPQFK